MELTVAAVLQSNSKTNTMSGVTFVDKIQHGLRGSGKVIGLGKFSFLQ